MRSIGVALGIALLWASAAIADSAATPGSPSPEPAVKIPQSVWRVGADRSAEHLQSGWLCPGSVDDYIQGSLKVYDGFGLDVSCDYRKPGTLLTLYITRIPPEFSFAGAYASAKDAILKGSPQRQPALVSEDQTDAGGFKWSRAVYAEDGGLHSALWLTMLTPAWYFEYRATYPADQEAAVDATLAKLAGMTAQSARKRLELCAKGPAPIRSGVLVTDAETQSDQVVMTSLLGGASQMEAQKKNAKSDAADAIVWCVETPSQQGPISLLFWRGINPRGSDASIDRVTGMTMGPPPVLEISSDSLANFVEQADAKGAPPPERWTAATHDGPQTWIFGYFDGRPGADLAGSLFANVLQGKAKPIGGYNAQGKTITINTPPAAKP